MPVQVMTEDQAREALAALGERRRDLKSEEKELREETEKVLRASRGVIPVKEACRLAGLNRSTVYELYLGSRDEESSDAADGRSEEGKRGPGMAG